MSVHVERYRADLAAEWNAFVAGSRNGTFLHDRRYMDYHHDRFEDHSLLLRDDDGRLVAVLPGNVADGALHSHGGLTYGGLLLGLRSGAADVLKMFEALRNHLRNESLSHLHYKTIPWIYHRQPAEDDRYALFRAGARLTRRDVLSVVPREDRLKYQERRARGIKAARKAGVVVEESTHYVEFWEVLSDNLTARHGVLPVHSLEEIELLHGRFPDAIRLFNASHDGKVVAGAVIYETDRVAHVQYISASESGRQLRALDLLFDVLLTTTFADKMFVDFGNSSERAGDVLNVGLAEQKEGFGARTVVHDYYELSA
ncbi:MAG: GNAT family N-acetyltransferase [Pseudomonadota bacterium]|nr:GNAT family N-acetyltransferase [Pseudomonadota bacterium]MDQ3057135.1 GNAT family N-acetyltransferase [Pseudomonadota bacterium]